jgi:hypothetical protein
MRLTQADQTSRARPERCPRPQLPSHRLTHRFRLRLIRFGLSFGRGRWHEFRDRLPQLRHNLSTLRTEILGPWLKRLGFTAEKRRGIAAELSPLSRLADLFPEDVFVVAAVYQRVDFAVGTTVEEAAAFDAAPEEHVGRFRD